MAFSVPNVISQHEERRTCFTWNTYSPSALTLHILAYLQTHTRSKKGIFPPYECTIYYRTYLHQLSEQSTKPQRQLTTSFVLFWICPIYSISLHSRLIQMSVHRSECALIYSFCNLECFFQGRVISRLLISNFPVNVWLIIASSDAHFYNLLLHSYNWYSSC